MLRSISFPESRLEELYLNQENGQQILCPHCGSKALLLAQEPGKLLCQNCLELLDLQEFHLSLLVWWKTLLEKVEDSLLHHDHELEFLQEQIKEVLQGLEQLLDRTEKESEISQILSLLAQASVLLTAVYDLDQLDSQALEQAKRNLLYREELIDRQASLENLFFLALAHFDLGILQELTDACQAEREINNGLSLLNIALLQAQLEEEDDLFDLFQKRQVFQLNRTACFYFQQKEVQKAAKVIEASMEIIDERLKKFRESEREQREKIKALTLGSDIYQSLRDFSQSLQMAQHALSLQKSLLEEKQQRFLQSGSDESEDQINDLYEILDSTLFLYQKLTRLYSKAGQKEKAFETIKEMKQFLDREVRSWLKELNLESASLEQRFFFYQQLVRIFLSSEDESEAEEEAQKVYEILVQNQSLAGNAQYIDILLELFYELLDLFRQKGNRLKQKLLLGLIDQLLVKSASQSNANQQTLAFWQFRHNCQKAFYCLDTEEMEKAIEYTGRAKEYIQALERENISFEERELAVKLFENQALLWAWQKDFLQARVSLDQADQLRAEESAQFHLNQKIWSQIK